MNFARAIGDRSRASARWLGRRLALWLREPLTLRARLFYVWGAPRLFQSNNTTGVERHFTIFREAALLLDQPPTHILSFGCSTGEEVFTLKSYFPSASIKGIDINRHNIAIAKRRWERFPDGGMLFCVGDSTSEEPSDLYDAIFCMAVLRNTALGRLGVTSSQRHIRFDDFASIVGDFARCIRPGGLLIIRHSNFRFCDTAAYGQFEPVFVAPPPREACLTPIFGPDNKLMDNSVYLETIFRKLGG